MHDYDKMTMEFKLGYKERIWTVLTSEELKSCEAIIFEKLCKGETHYSVIVMAKEELIFEVEKSEDESSLLLWIVHAKKKNLLCWP